VSTRFHHFGIPVDPAPSSDRCRADVAGNLPVSNRFVNIKSGFVPSQGPTFQPCNRIGHATTHAAGLSYILRGAPTRSLQSAYFAGCEGTAGAGDAGATGAAAGAAGIAGLGAGMDCGATGLAVPSMTELPLREDE
jgi:hypothetical protein